MMQECLLLSGGRTSGYMLRRQLDARPDYRENVITIFCNTGREMPKTLDFVHAIETRWDVPVIWLEYCRVPATETIARMLPTSRRIANVLAKAIAMESTHWFKRVNYETAARNGEPFDDLLKWMTVLPNVRARSCSAQLKIRTAMRYAFSLGLKEYISIIGIRADEKHRCLQIQASCDSFNYPQFPLSDGGVTKSDVNAFWKDADFDLGLQDYEGNCDLCFLKRKLNRARMAREHPERLQWWKSWERIKANCGAGGEFRLGEPYTLIEELANAPQEQELFSTSDDVDIPCSCAEKGFEKDDE